MSNVKDIGHATFRCAILGHRAGLRDPDKPDAWLGLACQRCGRYPVGWDGQDPERDGGWFSGSVGYTHSAERFRKERL